MNLLKILILLIFSVKVAVGQWATYNTNHTRHTNSGSVVIGSPSYSAVPAEKLEVFGNVRVTFTSIGTGNLFLGGGLLHVNHAGNNFSLRLNNTDRLTVMNSNGFVGINTTSPVDQLHVNGNLRANQIRSENGVFSAEMSSNLVLQTNGGSRLTILHSNGFVGINTTTPTTNLEVNGSLKTSSASINSTLPAGYRFSVGGKVIAEEVVVKLQSNWPDYVFEQDYRLRSLEEVASFIKQNKHLPEMPSLKEVEENGISIGKMNALLLKKIEELTLYILELKAEISYLKRDNKYLK